MVTFKVNGLNFRYKEEKQIRFDDLVGALIRWNLGRQFGPEQFDTLEIMCNSANRYGVRIVDALEIAGYIARHSDDREILGITWCDDDGHTYRMSEDERAREVLKVVADTIRIYYVPEQSYSD